MIHYADFEEATNDVSHDKSLSDDGSSMDINDCGFVDAESNGEDPIDEYKDEDKEIDCGGGGGEW